MIPYFCGNHEFCLQPTKDALKEAKTNVEKYYSIVGILEEYPKFLELASVILPKFFSGSVDKYKEMEKELKQYSLVIFEKG